MENTTLVPTEGNEILPLSASDLKYYEIVQRVRSELSKDCNTVKAACAAAGVTRRLFYDAIRSPYVQSQTAAEMDARGQAAQEVLERSWVRVLMNMANVATGPNARDAVTAARLLNDIRTEMEKTAKPDQKAQNDVAAELTRRFLAQTSGPVTVRETVREVVVE